MADLQINDLQVNDHQINEFQSTGNETGSELFVDSESFMDELDRDESLNIIGGMMVTNRWTGLSVFC